jgi:cyclopropane-fatty-acyl-phospholipid synthase
MLLARVCKTLIQDGALTLIDADGRTHRFGRTRRAADVVVRLTDRSLHWKLAVNPYLYLGEAYMDGTLTVERGDVYDLLDICGKNLSRFTAHPAARAFRALGRTRNLVQQYNPVGRARSNVAHHHDLSDVLYDHFLDRDRQYSCAYFEDPRMSLDEAQDAKKRHLTAKLLLRSGQRVLDIGSGWGGLSLHLARAAPVEVTGITLSERQLAVARRRAAEAELGDRVRFELRDFREETGRYDRVVSVGMFEHVGLPHYGEFFARLRDLLTEDGVAVIHAIGRMDGPSTTSPWVRKYIFPRAYVPALSELLPAIERARLWVTDVEILRLHYAETLRHWRRRFVAGWPRLVALYDERFCRMWEFYLALGEAGFRRGGLMVFQIQLARRVDTVPVTRDYLLERRRREGVTRVAHPG